MAAAKKTVEREVIDAVANDAAAATATVKKAVAKKTTAAKKAASAKVAEAKESVKKAAKTTKTTARTRKTAVKESISIQFAGKEYTTGQLVKIAKDVWEFDLQKEPADLKEVQLYVKPEEAKAYYVINGTETGSFDI